MSHLPRIAVIGAGNWGKNHVRVFNGLGVLDGVAEASQHLREAIQQTYPETTVYSDYHDVLQNSDIVAVVLATPAPTHYAIAREFLLAGKDVLVEKPMTLSVDDAEELVAIAESHSRILMVGHLMLYKPIVRKLVACVHDGLIGDPYLIEMRRMKLGTVRREENVFWSFAPHDVALLLQLVPSTVKTVTANGLSAIQANIQDDVRVSVGFEDGVQAHIHTSWLWPEIERRTTVVGSKGMLVYDEFENRLWLYRKGVHLTDLSLWDEGREEIKVDDADALTAQARHFLECIETRNTPLADGKRGAEVVNILVQSEQALGAFSDAKPYFVHKSAYVDEPVKIGEGTKIWHYSHIMSGADIGEQCNLGQNVFVGRNARIGNNVKIQNNVSVYEGVTLEDDVFCGPSMVFTNVNIPRSANPRESSDFLKTTVRRGCTIGANATIVCGVTLGEHSFVGAGAVVTKDVPPYALAHGSPATVKGWMCECGNKLTFEHNSAVCSECSRAYKHIETTDETMFCVQIVT